MGDLRMAYRVYTAANGDRRQVEVVSGMAYSAAQHSYLRSPDHQAAVATGSIPRGSGCREGQAASKWCFSDPEMKRRRRVAGYKIYAVEGKVKSSLRKGMRWIKGKCSEIVHGW